MPDTTGGYIYKSEGVTYLCANEPILMHKDGKHMLGNHYLTAIVINGDDFEDGQSFGPKNLVVDWDILTAGMELLKGKLPTVKAYIEK